MSSEMTDSQSQVLDRLKKMSRPELEALQFAKLQRQLTRVYMQNGFFRRRFDALGVKPDQIRSLAEFRDRVPTMGKADCLKDQEEHPPFGERVGCDQRDIVLMNLTGGTSGQGQEVFGRTNRDVAMQGHLHYLPWTLAGLRRGDVALNCVPAGGLTTGGWGPTEGFRVGGTTSYPVGGTLSTEAKIALMLRFRTIHFIYASTSYLHTLTEAMRRQGIDPKVEFPMLRTLYTAAESYPVEWARRIEQFWGAKLHEGYGSTQGAGFSAGTYEGAIEGDRRGTMYAFEWHNVFEVVDPETLRPVGPGEEGEILLTNLDIIGSPVIRFRTGDKARYIPPGAGTNGLPWIGVEAGTVSRLDDMMKIRGNNMWPSAVDGVVFRDERIAEYAGRVYTSGAGKTCVEVRIALKPESSQLADAEKRELLRHLAGQLKQTTNINMDLSVVDRSELPEFAYKSRRWKDERADGYRSGAIDR